MLKTELLRKLPEEIIRQEIIPYTYKPQSKELLADIRSFYVDWNILDNAYLIHYNYPVLVRDLQIYCRNIIYNSNLFDNDNEMFHDFTYDYRGLIVKYVKLKQTNEIRNYIYKMMVDFISRINNNPKRRNAWFLFGLMTPLQRTRFINKFILIE
jgi:hypothetical protein